MILGSILTIVKTVSHVPLAIIFIVQSLTILICFEHISQCALVDFSKLSVDSNGRNLPSNEVGAPPKLDTPPSLLGHYPTGRKVHSLPYRIVEDMEHANIPLPLVYIF